MVEKNTELDDLFAKARSAESSVPDDLTARLLSDAYEVQDSFVVPNLPAESEVGFRAQMRSIFGGWPTWGGLVAASLVGVWIGVAPPSFATGSETLWAIASEDLDVFDGFGLDTVFEEDGV